MFTKVALTSLQIVQFIVGLIVAGAFVLLEYQVLVPPVSYDTQSLEAIFASDLKSTTMPMMPTTSKDQTGLLWKKVRCVETNEEACPIWVGAGFVIFLLFMFVRFFARAYLSPGLGKKEQL